MAARWVGKHAAAEGGLAPAGDHPDVRTAVDGWLSLGGAEPAAVEVLADLGQRRMGKSLVYRLRPAGAAGAAVIAKRDRRTSLEVERFVYQDILPAVEVPAPRCHGLLPDEHPDLAWLFLEDVHGIRYLKTDPEHRALAAATLGTVHASTSQLDLGGRLPPVRPDRYLEFLRLCRARLQEGLGNTALTPEDGEVVASILGLLDPLESGWDRIEEFCAEIPSCLVHGDFYGKNALVRSRAEGRDLLLLDWEFAGWGTPAEDVAWLDEDEYLRRVAPVWRQVDGATIARMAAVGAAFKSLAVIQSAGEGLVSPWPDASMWDLRWYGERLGQACAAI